MVTRLDLPREAPLVVEQSDLVQAAARAAGDANPSEFRRAALLSGLALVSFFPVLWVVWAFAFRGGLGLRIAGLALVRASGRPALRLQCAWRALAVWAPLFALLMLVVAADVPFPPLLWLCALAQGLAALLVVAYAALALRFPRRGPHDWLAGTYLVPR
jgi:hypothetical protein